MSQPSTSSSKAGNKRFFEDEKTQVSKIKHGVLKRYLGAWFSILYQNRWRKYNTIVYIDGFSGPGKYSSGENGSPVLAYELAINLKCLSRPGGPDIIMIFIEKKEEFCVKLVENLYEIRKKSGVSAANRRLMKKVKYMVINGEFVNAMEWILSPEFQFPKDSLDQIFTVPCEKTSRIIGRHIIGNVTPILVFADPFGYNGKYIPMTLMRNILNTSRNAELLVNLMTGNMRRFWGVDNRTKPINLLIGNDEYDATWKSIVLEEANAKDKVKAFLQFYHEQIEQGCGGGDGEHRYTCFFELRDKNNKLMYNLYFTSSHNTGFQKMKDAMRKESQNEELFKFSAFDGRQPDFERAEVSVDDLKERIVKRFKGRVVYGAHITGFIENDSHLTQHFRSPLKRALESFQKGGNKRLQFDNILYDFTRKYNENGESE